jgi:hypothetical protein
MKLVTVFTKAVRFSGVETCEEKKREPVQPPIETLGFTPCILVLDDGIQGV